VHTNALDMSIRSGAAIRAPLAMAKTRYGTTCQYLEGTAVHCLPEWAAVN
jgi:hypothetical protein